MKFHVNNLILETTRKCNMKCAHCLRGDAQDIDMSFDTVRKILQMFDSFTSVTYSGGEPALNIPLIDFFFQEAEKSNKLPYSFFVATNGTNQWEMATTLMKWYPKMEDKEFCSVAISRDRFHLETPGPSYLESLCFYSSEKTHGAGASDDWVNRVGRAEDNGIGKIHSPSPGFYLETSSDNQFIDIDMLYISANELCIDDCDCTYETIDEFGIPLSQLPQELIQLAKLTA